MKTINLLLSYYNSENYSNFNSSALDKLYEDTRSLYRRAEEELQKVYEQYDLRSCWKDLHKDIVRTIL